MAAQPSTGLPERATMESLQTYDVVVIGAAVNGCSAAYHLAREGHTVAVVEQGMIAGEASVLGDGPTSGAA